MKKNKLIYIILLLISQLTFGSWQDRAMKKIDRKVAKIQKQKSLSKTQEIDAATIKFYFIPKYPNLVRIVEKKNTNGTTITTQYFFDKKTDSLISVNQGNTIYYFQKSGYFAVLSDENFLPEEAKKRANTYKALAQKYVSKIIP